MENYFIIINNEQEGPYSIEEIKLKIINKNTLVWNESLEDWTEVGKIEYFNKTLKKNPPPIPRLENEEKPIKVILTKENNIRKKKDYSKTINSLLSLIPWGIVLCLFISFSLAFGKYEINKFNNHNWSSVYSNGSLGYNFPLDKYSPSFNSSFYKPEKMVELLKLNVQKRKNNIIIMSLKRGIIGGIIGYLILVIIFFIKKART